MSPAVAKAEPPSDEHAVDWWTAGAPTRSQAENAHAALLEASRATGAETRVIPKMAFTAVTYASMLALYEKQGEPLSEIAAPERWAQLLTPAQARDRAQELRAASAQAQRTAGPLVQHQPQQRQHPQQQQQRSSSSSATPDSKQQHRDTSGGQKCSTKAVLRPSRACPQTDMAAWWEKKSARLASQRGPSPLSERTESEHGEPQPTPVATAAALCLKAMQSSNRKVAEASQASYQHGYNQGHRDSGDLWRKTT